MSAYGPLILFSLCTGSWALKAEVSEISRPLMAPRLCGGPDRNFSDCRVSMVQAQFIRVFLQYNRPRAPASSSLTPQSNKSSRRRSFPWFDKKHLKYIFLHSGQKKRCEICPSVSIHLQKSVNIFIHHMYIIPQSSGVSPPESKSTCRRII